MFHTTGLYLYLWFVRVWKETSGMEWLISKKMIFQQHDKADKNICNSVSLYELSILTPVN